MNAELPIRDIHLPDDMLWWPLAPGWYLLLAIGLFVGLLLYQKSRKHNDAWRHKAVLRDAHQWLVRLDNDKHKNNHEAVKEVSLLLRRTAMSLYGRNVVAGLSGENWLSFLDETSESKYFTQGKGKVLRDQPFKRAKKEYSAIARDELIVATQEWLSAQEQKGAYRV